VEGSDSFQLLRATERVTRIKYNNWGGYFIVLNNLYQRHAVMGFGSSLMAL